MDEAEEDVLTYAAFPAEHWQKVWSKTRWRVNKEVKSRTNVMGIFSNEAAVIRLVGQCSVSDTMSGKFQSVTSAPDLWRSWSGRRR